MKYICTALLLLTYFTSFSQIKKGDWLINGKGEVLTLTEGSRSSTTNINLELKLGYFFRDNWMIGGNVDLRSTRFSALTINEIFARHYLKDTLFNTRIYAEARWIFQQSTPTNFGGGSRRYTANSGVLGLGLNRFITPQLAIEAQLDYFFFQRFVSTGQSARQQQAYLTTSLGIQYFFRYRDWRVEREKDYRGVLSKGTWMIGGRMAIAERLSQTFYYEQNFNPSMALFIKRNWAVGSELNYLASIGYSSFSIGLTPFTRYYLNVGRKKKIFGELRTSYVRNFNERINNKYSQGYEWQYGLAFGLSNFINDNVSFDISYLFFKNKIRSDDFTFDIDNQRQGFNFAMHYFFTKK